jgi:hypothetical protein
MKAHLLRIILALGVALLLAACASGLPRPLPEPRTIRPSARQWIPMIAKGKLTKLGMAGCPSSCAAFGCSWCYSWVPDPGTRPGVESVPMIWGRKDLGKPLGGNSKWLMGFNEPDLRGQSDLSIQEAVQLWHDLEERYPDRFLVSVAPSHLAVDWLPIWREVFIRTYGRPPRVDALAVHCYMTADECIAMVKRYISWAKAWGVAEVWVTEMMQTSAAAARKFADWLTLEPMVTRFAPYVSRQDCSDDTWNCALSGDPSLLNADGSLTAKGGWYARPEWAW